MTTFLDFKRLKHQDIDAKAWNACLTKQRYRLYTQLWYLDLVSPHWEALVWGDYEAVLALPLNKKVFWTFLQNPLLCQQINISGNQQIVDKTKLVDYLKSTFDYVSFSSLNQFKDIIAKERCNQFLETKTYLETKAKRSLESNLKKAQKAQLNIIETEDVEQVFAFFRAHYHLNSSAISEKQWMFFKHIIDNCHKLSKARLFFVEENQEKVFAVFGIQEQGVFYYLLNISNEIGRQKGASYFFIDQLIRQNKHIQLIDFEGSSIKGVQQFYRNFGAKEETYYQYHHNRLPFFLKWFKA
ncbi:MAG: GNAT family N-acetyltransferase [Flavobacteriales bacterium]